MHVEVLPCHIIMCYMYRTNVTQSLVSIQKQITTTKNYKLTSRWLVWQGLAAGIVAWISG